MILTILHNLKNWLHYLEVNFFSVIYIIVLKLLNI